MQIFISCQVHSIIQSLKILFPICKHAEAHPGPASAMCGLEMCESIHPARDDQIDLDARIFKMPESSKSIRIDLGNSEASESPRKAGGGGEETFKN